MATGSDAESLLNPPKALLLFWYSKKDAMLLEDGLRESPGTGIKTKQEAFRSV
jgi:hypothetical protein